MAECGVIISDSGDTEVFTAVIIQVLILDPWEAYADLMLQKSGIQSG